MAQVQMMRMAGLQIQLEVNGWSVDSAFAYAAQTGVRDVLLWEEGFLHHHRDGDGDFVLLGPLDESRLTHPASARQGESRQ